MLDAESMIMIEWAPCEQCTCNGLINECLASLRGGRNKACGPCRLKRKACDLTGCESKAVKKAAKRGAEDEPCPMKRVRLTLRQSGESLKVAERDSA